MSENIWNIFWQSLWHSIWLSGILPGTLSGIGSLLTFFLAFHLASGTLSGHSIRHSVWLCLWRILSDILSGIRHCSLRCDLAVAVWQCPRRLRSGRLQCPLWSRARWRLGLASLGMWGKRDMVPGCFGHGWHMFYTSNQGHPENDCRSLTEINPTTVTNPKQNQQNKRTCGRKFKLSNRWHVLPMYCPASSKERRGPTSTNWGRSCHIGRWPYLSIVCIVSTWFE